MKVVVRQESDAHARPGFWQMAVIAICTLVLCSCRSAAPTRHFAGGAATPESAPANMSAGAVTPAGYTAPVDGAPCVPLGPPGMENGVPLPYETYGSWAPPGPSQPWPADEYLADGGDAGLPAAATKQAQVLGLELEDTVATFDTADGRTLVQPSNKVHIYSPRFGAVRQVVGVSAASERQKAGGVSEPVQLRTPDACLLVAGVKQNLQPTGEIGKNPAAGLHSKQGDGIVSNRVGPNAFHDRFKAFEDLAIVRQGMFEGRDMPMLTRGSNAAIAWSSVDSLQVIIDRTNAMADVKYDQDMALYTITAPPGKPRLQLVKVASTPFAKPGEEVDFTLRFDNVGTQTINNVTIIDNLTTRLEYIPNSAQCSVDAEFHSKANEGDSVVFQCRLSNPLLPGQGGIIRFRCRVR